MFCIRNFFCQSIALWLLLHVIACRSETSSVSATDVSLAKDSILRNIITERVDTLNARIRRTEMLPVKFLFPGHGPADSITYWLVDGRPVRAQALIFEDEALNWPTYFIDSSGLLLVRLRYEFKGDSTHFARETMNYIRNEKVVYAEERKVDLQPGETPGLIRAKPFEMSLRPLSEMQTAALKYYHEIMMAIDLHMLVGDKAK